MWQKFIKTADKFNDPGKFTTLYAYEWTSIPNGANMHRNVFFKDKPAAVPFSSFSDNIASRCSSPCCRPTSSPP